MATLPRGPGGKLSAKIDSRYPDPAVNLEAGGEITCWAIDAYSSGLSEWNSVQSFQGPSQLFDPHITAHLIYQLTPGIIEEVGRVALHPELAGYLALHILVNRCATIGRGLEKTSHYGSRLSIIHKSKVYIGALTGNLLKFGQLALAKAAPFNPNGYHGWLSSLELLGGAIKPDQLGLRKVAGTAWDRSGQDCKGHQTGYNKPCKSQLQSGRKFFERGFHPSSLAGFVISKCSQSPKQAFSYAPLPSPSSRGW